VSWPAVTAATGLLVAMSAIAAPSSASTSEGVAARDVNSAPVVSATGSESGSDALKAIFGSAEEAPGTAALNPKGTALTAAVSCPSPGNCAAGGWVSSRGFVIDEVDGSWRSAKVIADPLASSGAVSIHTISCTSAGNCVAGGDLSDRSGGDQAFVVSETNGSWGPAEVLTGVEALNAGNSAATSSVSCSSPGNCTAVGSYLDASDHGQPFVASEVGGKWQGEAEAPGIADLESGSFGATILSLSCGSAGNCSAGGSYEFGVQPYLYQAFIVDQVHGTWLRAVPVPGIAALNANHTASVGSVSCATAGNCTAGGYYEDDSYLFQGFVVDEVNGVWGNAQEMPGLGRLNKGGDADVSSVSCASPGNCSAGGYYASNAETNPNHVQQVFIANEVNGAWQDAITIPGTEALNTGGTADFDALSCASAGNCSGGGLYLDATDHSHAFAVTEVKGEWLSAAELPGISKLATGGGSEVDAIACGSAISCAATGTYTDKSGKGQAYVTSPAICTAADPDECLRASNAAYGLDRGTFTPPASMKDLREDIKSFDGYAGVALVDSTGNIIIANEVRILHRPLSGLLRMRTGHSSRMLRYWKGSRQPHSPTPSTSRERWRPFPKQPGRRST
jgi:hypothetical protein